MNEDPNLLVFSANPSPLEQEVFNGSTDELGIDRARIELANYRAELAFQAALDTFAESVPETVAEREKILQGATELISTFQVRPEFFDGRDRALIFASLSLSTAKILEAAQGGPGSSRVEIMRQQAFLTSATFLLTANYADAFLEQRSDHQAQLSEGKQSERTIGERINKHVHPEVTAALNQVVAEKGIFEEVRRRMGVADSQESPVTLQAISIGPSSLSAFDLKANGITWSEFAAWEAGLKARTERFVSEVPGGRLASKAAGFARQDAYGDHIYIPMTSAELFMGETRGIVLDDGASTMQARVLSTLRHEYAHTQDNVIVEGEFGKSLEERRAEHFSGNGGEYFEVKKFFRQLDILYGTSIGGMLDEVAAARSEGRQLSIYELLADRIGLDKLAEIAASQPDAYVEYARSSYIRDMLDPLGGFDEVVGRAAMAPRVDKQLAIRRMTAYVNNLRFHNQKGEGYEEFLSRFFKPILHAFGLKISDIKYVRPD